MEEKSELEVIENSRVTATTPFWAVAIGGVVAVTRFLEFAIFLFFTVTGIPQTDVLRTVFLLFSALIAPVTC